MRKFRKYRIKPKELKALKEIGGIIGKILGGLTLVILGVGVIIKALVDETPKYLESLWYEIGVIGTVVYSLLFIWYMLGFFASIIEEVPDEQQN